MNNFTFHQSPKRASSRRKRRQDILILVQGALLSFMCVCITGAALYLGGFNPFRFPVNLTATAVSERNASCKALIDKAIQASGSYCGGTSSNKVCYGNTTIKAELASDATQRFSERGDIIGVNELRRLSASPLNLNGNEWGIAVFKVIANLPRSLPGETVTMLVFGNTTLDNASGNLQSFYFYSELGQITCEAVPFDGLMISAPDGTGLRINVNGAELTLMGSASLKAVKNGDMEVSILHGSGRIVSNGQEQYFGAGEKVRVGLGGENGVQAISGPSAPEPITQQELNTACTMTGQYCSPSQVTPVSAGEAQQQLQTQITSTATPTFTQTSTTTPSATLTPTSTTFVLPSWTPWQTATPTRTPTVFRTATRTRTRTPTPTRTSAPRTNTPTQTSAPIVTFTDTPTPTSAPPSVPTEPICGAVSLSGLNANSTELGMSITNDTGTSLTIDRFFADWVKLSPSQKLDKLLLNGNEIWNISDNTPPSDIPSSDGNWVNGADRTIPGDNSAQNFVVQFQDPLEPGTYEVHIVFNFIPCQVTDSVTIP